MDGPAIHQMERDNRGHLGTCKPLYILYAMANQPSAPAIPQEGGGTGKR